MTTTTFDIKAAMTPFAEHPCQKCGGKGWTPRVVAPGQPWASDMCGDCGGSERDPRFEALRGEHEFRPYDCVWCGITRVDLARPYCLRTDLGSIVAAGRACGFHYRGGSEFGDGSGRQFFDFVDDAFVTVARGVGDTDAEAAARAFVAAVPLEPNA